MAATGAVSLSHTAPRICAGRDAHATARSFAELPNAAPCFLGSIHPFRFAHPARDHCSLLLLTNGVSPSALRNVSVQCGGGNRSRAVQCRAAESGGAGGSSPNGAAAPLRRRSSRSEAERDRQFVIELRQVMDSKDLPKLTVPSPAQLSDRPDLAKGLRARGQFQVARLLGQYAAAEQASPPPSRPPGFPTPLEIISPVDAQTPTVPQTSPPNSKRNGGISSTTPARIPIESPADSAPKIPSSIFDQLEADAQQAPEKGGRSGSKGIPLRSRDPQATTAAVEWLRQLGSVSEDDAPATPTAAPATRSMRPLKTPPRQVTPSVSERAARFLQTGKMDGAAAAEASTTAPSEGPAADADTIAAQKAALLRAKLRPRSGKPPAPAAAPAPVAEPVAPIFDSLQSQNEQLYRDILTEQQQLQQLSLSEKQDDDDFKAQTFQELKRIKEALTNREGEVASMGEALKEARAQLNLLRAKSAAELSQARQENLELQTRLRSMEKALEGLKQVRVEYWGQGEVVQMAGSFNGWSNHFTLEPDLSTEIPPPGGGRGPILFSCDMRLYPGEYEVKFIVDGVWQVDSRREIVYKGLIQNNLLRVE